MNHYIYKTVFVVISLCVLSGCPPPSQYEIKRDMLVENIAIECVRKATLNTNGVLGAVMLHDRHKSVTSMAPPEEHLLQGRSFNTKIAEQSISYLTVTYESKYGTDYINISKSKQERLGHISALGNSRAPFKNERESLAKLVIDNIQEQCNFK